MVHPAPGRASARAEGRDRGSMRPGSALSRTCHVRFRRSSAKIPKIPRSRRTFRAVGDDVHTADLQGEDLVPVRRPSARCHCSGIQTTRSVADGIPTGTLGTRLNLAVVMGYVLGSRRGVAGAESAVWPACPGCEGFGSGACSAALCVAPGTPSLPSGVQMRNCRIGRRASGSGQLGRPGQRRNAGVRSLSL